MLDIMFEAPTITDLDEIIVDADVIRRKGKPEYKYKPKKGKKTA